MEATQGDESRDTQALLGSAADDSTVLFATALRVRLLLIQYSAELPRAARSPWQLLAVAPAVAVHRSCSKGEALPLQGGGNRPWRRHLRCPAKGGGGATGIEKGRGDCAMQTGGGEAA
jgi:hypothetical protein